MKPYCGPLSTFLLVFMAGLIFFNLSENQFVHIAASLPSGALHHTSTEFARLGWRCAGLQSSESEMRR